MGLSEKSNRNMVRREYGRQRAIEQVAVCTDRRTGKNYGFCKVVRCKHCPLFKHGSDDGGRGD
jgi:hypothetical protein